MDELEQRKRGTEDETFIPSAVVLDESVGAVMAARADECEQRGHTWHDPNTRALCTYCGAAWSN